MPPRLTVLATTATIVLICFALLFTFSKIHFSSAGAGQDELYQQPSEPQSGNDTDTHRSTQGLICIPYGQCERCPEDALHQPFCQPFGNRRLMHCRKSNDSFSPTSIMESTLITDPMREDMDSPSHPRSHTHRLHRASDRLPRLPPPLAHDAPPPFSDTVDTDSSETSPPPAATPPLVLAWESCGRVVSTERADFLEFLGCNLLFACVGIALVQWRARRLKRMHERAVRMRIARVRTAGGA